MKKFLTLLVMAFLLNTSYAYVVDVNNDPPTNDPEVAELMQDLQKISLDDLMTLTPKKYKELTGKRMGMKNAVKLKIAKKKYKKMMKKRKGNGAAVSKGLYIFLAIIGWGWLGMGLNDDWDGNDWIICLVLSLFTCLGGLIYALVKKKKYY